MVGLTRKFCGFALAVLSLPNSMFLLASAASASDMSALALATGTNTAPTSPTSPITAASAGSSTSHSAASAAATQAAALNSINSIRPKRKGKVRALASPIFETHSDPLTAVMSADAVQLSNILSINSKLRRLLAVYKELEEAPSGSSPAALREERSDLKFDILETVEETRLQIDIVNAEIDEEEVILEEAMRIYTTDRDNRVNRANQAAFRTNGVLWAVAEAISIPTYKQPTLSIPAGTVGIVAGIVPSIFSGYAARQSAGLRYKREIYPNILTGIFGLPTIPRVEFPEVVWQYFNSCPENETRTRRQVMKDHWLADRNISIFRDGISSEKLLLLTGNKPYTSDMELVSDKLIMIGQIKAVTLQMCRPLLEICMAVRGKKQFIDTN
jgi:hypothetical protein